MFSTCSGDVNSNHIQTPRLIEVVHTGATLTPAEFEHLKICLDCLEQMRSYVRQEILRSEEQHDSD